MPRRVAVKTTPRCQHHQVNPPSTIATNTSATARSGLRPAHVAKPTLAPCHGTSVRRSAGTSSRVTLVVIAETEVSPFRYARSGLTFGDYRGALQLARRGLSVIAGNVVT